MAGHAERVHSLLSTSGAHIWMNCTPSARLGEEFPDTTSDAAAEGTLAHELAEMKLRNYFYSVDFGKRKFTAAVNKLKKESLWDDEMMGYTDEYLDYIKNIALGFRVVPYVAIEKQIDLSTYVPEGFGTCDCVLISGSTIHVIDFKYGKGVPVSAEGNPQLALYALGAYEAYKILYPIDWIELHIIQPRIDNFSNWGCPLSELLTFGKIVREKAELAYKGAGEFRPSTDTCRFCRAKGRCRARADENVKLAFAVGKKPPLITNEEMGEYLKIGKDVAKWLGDLQDVALADCLAGKDVPGWKAVEGRGSRDWTDMDEAFAKLQDQGINEAVLWERKPLTLAQVEKVVGKTEFQKLVGNMVIKNPGKPTLAEASDKREAITNKVSAAEAFKNQEEKDHE